MTRALVLGGGGPVGIAWEAGLLAGLAEGGVDLGGRGLHPRHLGRLVRRLADGDGPQGRRHRRRRSSPRPIVRAAIPRPGSRPSTPPAARRTSRAVPEDAGSRARASGIPRRSAARSAHCAGGRDHRRGELHRELRPPAQRGRRPTRGPRAATPAPRSTPRPASSWSGTPTARCGCRGRWPPAAACPGVYPPITINGRQLYRRRHALRQQRRPRHRP